MTGRASTSSSFQYHFTYDVFLNFRGKDTRPGFTGSLYHALDQKGIHTFFDDEEIRKGDEIAPRLDRAIEESRMAICVFSKDYASSTFCLNELVKIHQSIKKNGRLVWPIFYDVEPAEVRHQKGNYGQALSVHKQDLRADEEKLQSWKLALREVANLSGTHVTPGHDYEYKTIERIVKEIFCKINRGPLHVAEYPVGLDIRFQKVNSLLQIGSHDEVIMVGIYGIGGSGKTTLARIVYNSIADNFEGLCFLHDIKEEKLGLERMQERMLSKILGVDIKIDYANEGVTVIKERLRQKRILLILDNVDKLEQLQKIAGHGSWFGSGSRIIITTRDKHLLKRHRVERKYEMEALSNKESLQLLSWNAFQSAQVDPSYNEVVDRVIHYAHGLPLALEVIGSHLFGMSIEGWQSAINMYERIPQEDIQRILKVSYDGLNEVQKDIFLDIACFYKGHPWKQVNDMVEYAHGFDPHEGIQVLVNKCLIKDNAYGYQVDIHDLIQDMGREIVRQESPNEPGKRSRLRSHKDIMHVLEENTTALNLSVLNLQGCQNITQIPDLSGISNLKKLTLRRCKNLIAVDDSVGELERLEVLDAEKCAKLKTFPHCIKSPCLSWLNLSYCSSLKYFPEILPKVPLRLLFLEDSGIEKLPACIKECMLLKALILEGCKHLQEVEGIPPNLERLYVTNCISLSLESRNLLLSKEVIVARVSKYGACCSKEFSMPGSIIPEWMDVCKKGGPISFWFRNVIPTFCYCALLTPGANYECDFDFEMRINGILVCAQINGHLFDNICQIKEDSIIFCVPDRDIDYERKHVFRGGVWNNAEISIRQHSLDWGGVKESGIYMIREHCNMEDIRFTSPLNLNSLNIDQECTEHLAEYLETVFNLSKSTCRDWVECMRKESIPEWFHKRTKGGRDVSFWFRNNFPTLYVGALQNSDCSSEISVWINYDYLCSGIYDSSLKLGNTVVYGIQLASFDEKDMKRAFLEGEWNCVEIDVCDAKESGIYVTEQQYNKEDIRFTDPDMDAMANQESWCRLESWCGLDDDDEDEDEDEDEDVEGEQPMLKKRWLMEDNHVISDSISVDQEQEPPVSSKKDLHGNLLQPQEIEYESKRQAIDIQSPSRENEELVQVRRLDKNMTQ